MRLATAGIVVALWSILAAPVRGEGVGDLQLFSYDDGNQIVFGVTEEQVLKTPAWDPRDDAPPLTPRRADKVAHEVFKKLIRDRSGWRRHRIALDDCGDGRHWIYVVEFGKPNDDGSDYPNLRVIVLMDGKVAEHRVTKE